LAHWAETDLRRAVERGLLRGDPDGNLRPDDPVTRAEAAVLLNRLYDMAKENPDEIIPLVEPAVVMIVNERTGTLGSGVSVGGGYIVTNAHVVLNEDGGHEFMYGIHWSAEQRDYAMGPVVYIRPERDLAILRADIGEQQLLLPRLELSDRVLRKGEPATAVGSPVGLIGTVTHGVVSKADRGSSYVLPDGQVARFAQVVQIDAPISPGNSGGALVDRWGRLIGIPSAKLVHLAIEGLAFCIGVGDVREVLAECDLDYIPHFSRPDYEGSPEGYTVKIQTHYMSTANVTHLVVHHTGDLDSAGRPIHRDTSAEQINRFHRTAKNPPWAGIGYHFVIRWNGRVQIGRSIYTQGAHAGASMNPRSWGVVLSGNFDVGRPTGEQIASFRWLRRYLGEVKPGLIVGGHREYGATSCPGRNLSIADLVA